MPSSSPPRPAEDGGDDDVYYVKRILAEEIPDDERLFLIEWEGYPIEESTWEPEGNISSKETLKAWTEEKLRQREGLSQPLDTEEFERRQEKYAKRKQRREKLGLPQQSMTSESEYEDDSSSSDEAEEAYVGVPDYEGIPLPKISRQTQDSRRDNDIVMNDAPNGSAFSPPGSRRAPEPARVSFRSKNQHRNEASNPRLGFQRSELRTSAHKAPIVEAPSATGYQGTANRAPTHPLTSIPRGQSLRGRSRTTGQGSRMTMMKPSVPRTIENRILRKTCSKEPKAPQYFATKRMERKFELGARALADRPPAQLPRLINPADYANQARIRKKKSAPVPGGAQTMQTPVSPPGVAEISQTLDSALGGQQPFLSSTAATAPMVSSAEEFYPQEETTNPVGHDLAGQMTDKPLRPPKTRKVSFAAVETNRDHLDHPSHTAPPSMSSPASAFHSTIPHFAFSSSTSVHGHSFHSGVPDPAPRRKVSLADYSSKQNAVTRKPVPVDNHVQAGLGETTLKSFLGNGQAQNGPIMLTFIDVNVNVPSMIWRGAVEYLQGKSLTFNRLYRSTDVDNWNTQFNPILMARGRVTAASGNNKDQENILADYLRLHISGLLYSQESLNIIIYPTRCEGWKFIE
ncbi:hypothetical protein ACLOAV_004511 [Pseudogymnoascus australis]